MERQHQYKPGITAQVGNLREGHVSAPPQVEGAGAGILRAAMALGGEVMNVVAKDYAREMRGRMDDSILRTNAEFEKWKTEYKRTRQGVDALTAQKDFADKYMELADRAVAEFGGNGNEVYLGDLKREYAKYGFYAVKEGGAYQLQQDEAWQKSQWDAQLSAFQKIVDDNPQDAEMLELEARTLLQSWEAKNPGKDAGAMRDQIQSMLANGRMNAFLARAKTGDMTALDEAERLLGGGGNEPNHTGPRGHTIAEDLCNPLNLKKVGGGEGRAAFRQFANDADGFRGAHHQLKLYYNRDGLKTPRAMISKWAPKSENNLKDYFETVRQHGIDIDAPVNMNDPQQASRLIKAMATHEGPLGSRYSYEQVEGFLRGQGGGSIQTQAAQGQTGTGQSGQSISGFTATQRMHYQTRIDAARKRDMAELRVGLEMQLNDFFAAAEDGKAGAFSIDAAQIVAAYGDKADKVLARVNEALKLSDAVERLKATDAEGINKIMQEMLPETPGEGYAAQRHTRDKYRQIAQAHLLERAKNPTGYLMNVNPDLQKAYNAMLQNPTPETVNAYLQGLQSGADVLKLGNVPIFPQGQAQALSNAIMAQPNPGETLERLSDAFGQHWGRAFQELSAKDCLPVAAQVIANAMDQTDAKLLMEGIKDKDFQNKFYDLRKNDTSFAKKDFDEQVLAQMAGFNATLLTVGDQSTATELNRAVSTLAMQYMNTLGLDYKDAIQKAAKNVILDKYSLQSVNGGKFRVPKAFDGDAVERGAGAALLEIAGNADELLTAQYKHLGEHAATMFGNQIKRAGHWATNADESGLILFVGPNAVLDKKGQPVMRTWAQLQKSAKSWQEQQREQMFDSALAAGMEE